MDLSNTTGPFIAIVAGGFLLASLSAWACVAYRRRSQFQKASVQLPHMSARDLSRRRQTQNSVWTTDEERQRSALIRKSLAHKASSKSLASGRTDSEWGDADDDMRGRQLRDRWIMERDAQHANDIRFGHDNRSSTSSIPIFPEPAQTRPLSRTRY